MAEAGKVGLVDQIASVERAAHEIGALLKERDFYRQYPQMVGFEVENLNAVVRTLRWFETHEQTIRSAVRLAVDTAQKE